MFDLQRQKVLDECGWEPGEGRLRYIEARTFANSDASTPDSYEEGDLSDLEVDDWLHQRGRFVQPTDSPIAKADGNIRMLLCERSDFQPLIFSLSKASFLAIEKKLDFPIDMIPLFKFNGGGHSYHFLPYDQTPEQENSKRT
ncbi:hypothetical protein DE146DRAFT_317666 [Phaeosphaeria sp. MPI-PUGE-AT-0046c]|nr:hypothetical protein DE146DRAFT_317666 [Phaeosphaeria sp. MPI-PUGE-AT-0046c]